MESLQYEMFSDETLDELKTGKLKDRDQSGKLTERELIIIKMRFGIDMPNQQSLTLDQIGKIFGLTKERVRQLETRGMRKMRNNADMQKLRHLVIGDVT
jgi:RNA polymerase primary sigma factor